MATNAESKITPDDLEKKLQSFQDGVQKGVSDRKQTIATVGGGLLIVMLLVFFLLGRRAGKKKTTMVEIRRF